MRSVICERTVLCHCGAHCVAEAAHLFKSWCGEVDVITWRCPVCKLGFSRAADPSHVLSVD